MAYAILYDTGFATAGITGTVALSSNRAGVNSAGDSTSAFPLQIQTETMNGGGSLQTDTEIRNTDQLSNVSPVTFSNPKFVLNCSIPVESIDNTDFKHGWLYQLIRFERTKGVKILAFKSNNTYDFSGNSTQQSSTTVLVDSNALYGDDELIGKYILFTTGDNSGIEREITDNDTTQIGFAAVNNVVKSGDKYIIYDKPYDYVYNRQPTLPELYGMRYLEEPTSPIVSLLTGQTSGTTPHLVGYVKSISNVTYSSKDNLLRFALTFIVIEDLT